MKKKSKLKDKEARKLLKIKDIERKYLERVSHIGIYNLYEKIENLEEKVKNQNDLYEKK